MLIRFFFKTKNLVLDAKDIFEHLGVTGVNEDFEQIVDESSVGQRRGFWQKTNIPINVLS